jgi:hypothetical protein
MVASRNTIRLRFKVEGLGELQRAARAIAEPELPYLREALMESASLVADSARGFARGGIASRIGAPKLTRGRVPASRFEVRHPGSRSMEFGRRYYYRGYRRMGGRMEGAQRFRATRGQEARPYIGIIHGDAAVGASADRVKRLLAEAVSREWDRLGGS